MDAWDKILSGLIAKQRPKVESRDSRQNIDIKDIERSDRAENQEMAQAGRMKPSEGGKAALVKGRDGLPKSQQPYNELSSTHIHQQLDKREVAVTKKVNTELEDALQENSEDSLAAHERYKSLLRENKALKDDLEELALAKKTVRGLREQVGKMEANSRTHQKEMAMLQDALTTRKADLDKAIELNTAAEHKSKKLQSELETTWTQLQLCKDDLFRLQPMAQPPDSEIIKDFESMCQDIIGWIDAEISSFEKSYPSAELSHIFSGGDLPEAIYLLQQFPTFGEYWVRWVVHRSLYNNMFSRSVYLLGLPKEMKQCLQAAEKRMASLEPPRDSKTIHVWRSETLTAIAATPDFTSNREAEINDILEMIFQDIGRSFPIIHFQVQSRQRLLYEVVLPAARLASKIQGAATIYEVYVSGDPFRKRNRFIINDHTTTKMVDIKTRKIVKGSSATSQNGERRISNIVIPIEPSLSRIDEDEASTLLRPEVYLTEITNH